MSQTTTDQLKLVSVRAPFKRVLLVVPVLLALFASWSAARWYLGNTMAEFAPRLEDGGMSAAESAVKLAPDDPLTHWTLAAIERNSFTPEQLQESVRQYETAVSLSPNDYRLWLDLGRAREQSGDAAGGEKALRRAVELAPAYSSPHWYLGNLLLRAGRLDEAFAELRRASLADANFRPQTFNLAWQVYKGSVADVVKAVGDDPAARAQLSTFLVAQGRTEDALTLWSNLSAAEKKEQHATGTALINALLAARQQRAALEVYRELAADGASIAAGQFVNGGFETDLNEAGASPFGWQIKSVQQAQAALDALTHHSGQRSLRLSFRASSAFAFDNNISQLVVVEPATEYQLQCFVRTDDLKSLNTPLVEILDADGKPLAASPPIPAGKSDWQPLTLNFKTNAKTEAVVVRIGRAPCAAEGNVCPIYGTVWYDDFTLKRNGGNADAGDNRGAQTKDGNQR